MSQLKIAVLMGGANTERHVSRSSGLAIAKALRGLGHAVTVVDSALPPSAADPTEPDDDFSTDDLGYVAETPQSSPAAPPPTPAECAELRAQQIAGVLHPEVMPVLEAADVVFLTVFGDEGESGATQAFLDEHGIVYTGPSAEVCARTFDKVVTKRILAGRGIDTPRWQVVGRDAPDVELERLEVPGPWIVKPIGGGSTIGLSFVEDRRELREAIGRATTGGGDALIEEFIDGRDLTIGMLGEQVLAVVEASTSRELYDYTAKYEPGRSQKKAPADLAAGKTAEIKALTERVHRELEIGDTSSRTDVRLDADGRVWFLEVNPLPGMTPTSSYPISARVEGFDFPQLCEELVHRALARTSRQPTTPWEPR